MNSFGSKKRTWSTYPVVGLVMLGLLFTALFQVQAASPKSDVVHIVSDRLEAYQQKQQVIFIGHVVAKQGELTIRGDRMTIFYLEDKAAEAKDDDPGGRIQRIDVEGNVRITHKNTLATGKHAVYYSDENKFILTGKPRVQQNKNFIQGDKITHFLDSEKSIVEGGPSGPVEATIFSTASGGSVDRSSAAGVGESGTDRDTGG